MNGENFNTRSVKLRALVAPLDWGLGHATRCVPVIKQLIINGFEVIVAAEGAIKKLLSAEFPSLVFLPLKGYNIRYGRGQKQFVFTIARQIPKILQRIRYEQGWLKKAVKEHHIDVVISDNRPGLYHHYIPTVYITHQLSIKTGNDFTARIAQKMHYRYINKFTECWVPDAEGKINLAGDLSHPPQLPKVPVKYLGPLSRFEKINNAEKKYDLLILLSGPEPQRSFFEKTILQQLQKYTGAVLMVRGLPADKSILQFDNSTIQQANHLSSSELSEAIQQSKLVISRSGYTTVMDLAKLRQEAVLVPTPGQTEQEYLASRLMEQKLFCCVKQDQFVLADALLKAKNFSFTSIDIPETYQTIIKEWKERL